MNARHLVMGTLLALASLASGGALAADPPACPRSVIKIDPMPDGRVRVPVTVEGHKLSFVLDTGGVSTTLTWERAKELGLPVRQSVRRLVGVGGSLLSFEVAADHVSVGDLAVKSRPIYVEARNLRGADGTLGSDILRDYDVEIDLAAGTLSLIEPGSCDQAAAASIPMEVARDGHIRFPVKVDGKRIIATLDTGGAMSLLAMSTAAYLGIYPSTPALRMTADTGQYQIYAYPFQSLEFGGVAVKDPHIAVASDSFLPDMTGDLVLGIDALRQTRFIIAYGERRLLILAPGAN